jgi:lysozyme family protein
MRYSAKWPEYAKQWDAMRINKDRIAYFEHIANYAISHKARYQRIELRTTSGRAGVKWYHIALLHRRESDANFDTYLGNGQSLYRVTTLVPTGRGPFKGPAAFEDGAVDALRIDGLTTVIDWRLEKILYYCEIYNGTGYDSRGKPSPYIWGGTNIQKAGKYVADRVYKPNVWDTQPGCAPMLWMIAKLDKSVVFDRET